jgi:3-hydroxypropanoate dehydrogenase
MRTEAELREISSAALDQLFFNARSMNTWTSIAVEESLLRRMYEIARMGPTSVNSNPMRCIWVRSEQNKRRLAELAFETNRGKVLSAPVTAIIGYDVAFAARAQLLFPDKAAFIQKLAAENGSWAEETAFRNGTLQAAYLIIAARALGLDCGPMSGFDNRAVDAAFFAGSTVRSNLLCSFGYGSTERLFERLPRLAFEDANQLI